MMESSVNTSIFLVISPNSSFYMNHTKNNFLDDKLCPFLSGVRNITLGEEDYSNKNTIVELQIIQNMFHGSTCNSSKIIIILSGLQHNDESKVRRLLMDLRKKDVVVLKLRLSNDNSQNNTYGISMSGVHHLRNVNRKLKEAICHQHQCFDRQHPSCNHCIYNSQSHQEGSFCQSLETHSKPKRHTTSSKTCQDNVCLNGGTCIQGIHELVCKCSTNFSGTKCENSIKNIDCASNPCKNGGICFDREKGFRCCCSKGYNGKFCERKESPCDLKKCFNGGNCTSDPQGPACDCPNGFVGERCEINLEFQVDFQAEFSGFTSQYIKLHNKRHLTAVTVAFWMKSTYKERNYRGTPFSYSYENPYTKTVEENALTLFDTNKFQLYLHQDRIITDVVGNRDNVWHHCAITWEGKTGDWAIYWDGIMKASGSNVATGSHLWSGYFVIGQEQDSLGGTFSQGESYIGAISQFNVWDHAISANNIHLIMKSCGLSGNVISWGGIRARKGKTRISGIIKPTDLCSGIGMCGEKNCYCNSAKLLRSRKCWRSLDLSTCIPNPCENGQRCIMERASPQCSCEKGFEGTFCEYDIDECLQNNGNCGEKCRNTNGSYECSCEGGKRLASDKHRCVEESDDCLHQSGEDTYIHNHGDTWMESCKECHCDKGEVICNPKSCPVPNCRPSEKEMLSTDKCCLTCVADYNYCNHSGRIYDNNDVWSSDCINCTCKSGAVSCREMASCPVLSCKQDETDILLPWDCCKKCVEIKPSCQFEYENEISTFDGLKYSLSGTCRYILSTDCKNEGISIQYESSPYSQEEKTLIIHYKCIEVKIHSTGMVFIEDEKVETPYMDKRFIYIHSSFYKDNAYMHVYIIDGTWIRWEFPWTIEIWSPPKYKHQLCGLCGNYNGKYDDDQLEPSKISTIITDSSYEPLNHCRKPQKLLRVEDYSTSLSFNVQTTRSPSSTYMLLDPQTTKSSSAYYPESITTSAYTSLGPQTTRSPSSSYGDNVTKLTYISLGSKTPRPCSQSTPSSISDVILIFALSSSFVWHYFV